MATPAPSRARRIWPLSGTIHGDGGERVLRLAGRLGTAGAATLDPLVEGALSAPPRRLVLDLGGVDYASGAGLMALQRAVARAAAAGVPVALTGVQDAVRLAVDLAGLSDALPLEPAETAAGRPPAGPSGAVPGTGSGAAIVPASDSDDST